VSAPLLQFCEWLESTSLGVIARESLWGFQAFVGIHILGLALSVGTLVWFDLRLVGVSMRRVPVSAVYRRLMPWTLAGFAVMFLSGGALLAGFATAAYGNVYFRLKATAIVLAGVNALVYHLVSERGIAAWDTAERPPGPARMAGLVSIVLWATVILCGRMMSYTMF
jgi:hypothetical protein